MNNLAELVRKSAVAHPHALAVRGPDGDLSYRELDALANQVARTLRALGVGRGDRVALWLDKSARGVACMQGILRLGAVYVPVDPLSPAQRAQSCMKDCSVAAVVANAEKLTRLDLPGVAQLCVEERSGQWISWTQVKKQATEPLDLADVAPSDLAYILYTSGSTGVPKGVCITHQNAYAFVSWSANEVGVRATDRLANHAPFHFDLSVFDLYAAFLSGAAVVIVPEGAAYAPAALVRFIVEQRISVWYSVPSALIMMMDDGGLLTLPELPLRVVVFAGEVFPPQHLARLYARYPSPRYFNFYGPTETNVCTAHEVSASDVASGRPVPIGRAASFDRVWARAADGSVARVGEEGELLCEGPTVMAGYWGQPQHEGSYNTGDVVRVREGGLFEYVGRRDAMVKVRGYRIELGDVESALARHARVHDVAVVVRGTGREAELVAFVVPKGESPPTLLSLKAHCASLLPRYMILDELRLLTALPRTGNGKTDRRRLLREADSPLVPQTVLDLTRSAS